MLEKDQHMALDHTASSPKCTCGAKLIHQRDVVRRKCPKCWTRSQQAGIRIQASTKQPSKTGKR